MRSLGETQAAFRHAVSGGPAAALLPWLRAPADPLERLEIYRRHYRESFRRHLRGRYPTLEWLLGTDRMIELSDTLLQRHPPRAPSLAEYGEGLIALVAEADARHPAWLADVARLDWHLGCVSVETEAPPVGIGALAGMPPEQLLALALTLQPGLVYVVPDWPVDQLVHLRLGGPPPERLAFDPHRVHLELRGGRGNFSLLRLDAAEHGFRRTLAEGGDLGTAAQAALGADPGFDLSAALARLFATGLVAAIPPRTETDHV